MKISSLIFFGMMFLTSFCKPEKPQTSVHGIGLEEHSEGYLVLFDKVVIPKDEWDKSTSAFTRNTPRKPTDGSRLEVYLCPSQLSEELLAALDAPYKGFMNQFLPQDTNHSTNLRDAEESQSLSEADREELSQAALRLLKKSDCKKPFKNEIVERFSLSSVLKEALASVEDGWPDHFLGRLGYDEEIKGEVAKALAARKDSIDSPKEYDTTIVVYDKSWEKLGWMDVFDSPPESMPLEYRNIVHSAVSLVILSRSIGFSFTRDTVPAVNQKRTIYSEEQREFFSFLLAQIDAAVKKRIEDKKHKKEFTQASEYLDDIVKKEGQLTCAFIAQKGLKDRFFVEWLPPSTIGTRQNRSVGQIIFAKTKQPMGQKYTCLGDEFTPQVSSDSTMDQSTQAIH